jgi:hypothetical protein
MMKGMVVDYASRYGEAAREMAGWMAAGQLKSREDIVEGLATFPDTLLKLFKGENTGSSCRGRGRLTTAQFGAVQNFARTVLHERADFAGSQPAAPGSPARTA